MRPSHITPRQAFVLVVLAASASLLAWAALARVDVIVRTEGRIVPAGKAQIVQHLEGGIVRSILVHEGEVVRAGQILLELSDIQDRSTVQQERSRSAMLRGREARLLAESTGATTLVFPADLQDAEVQRAETAAFQSRRARVNEELGALREQTAQKRGEIAEAESRRHNLASEAEVVQQQLRVLEGLKHNGAASHMEVLDSQSRLQHLLSQVAEAEAALPRLRAAVGESESRAGEVLAKFRAEASGELTQIRGDLEKSGFELNTTTDRLERNRVRAPVSGFVNRLSVATIGGVVRPGEALMEITSDDGGVLIEAHARPNDRAGLHSGLPARVRIGAYDYATYGTLDARVTEVSADTLGDEHEGRYYRVMVKIDARASQPLATLPGMTAQADIVVGKRTILSYVVSPLMRFRDSAFRDPV